MKVLVTGGTGVIGEGVVPPLLMRGCTVRILSRGADDDVRRWEGKVEPFAADISDAAALRGAAEGCDAVIHITGIAQETPPDVTFEKVNVGGTRNILAEAERAGVGRFIFISSLGAERGSSDYHRSKAKAEDLVRGFKGDWLILRPGNVYGPGDEVISVLLQMMRALPAVPVVDAGDQQFQPVWYQDLGNAIARAVERDDLRHQTLELAGSDITTMNDLLDRLSEITGRSPARVPVPSFLASTAAKAAAAFGVDAPVDEQKLTMLLEENYIRKPVTNALIGTFGIEPLKLSEGLRLLADAAPEQLPSEGVGSLERKKFWADIDGSRFTAEEMIRDFRLHVNDIMPIDFASEPGAPSTVEEGLTLTAALPARGTIQMRVEEVTPRRVTFATLQGHPLAGVVRFIGENRDTGVRFLIEVYAKAADAADFLAMNLGGKAAQSANWKTVVERMIERSGGTAPKGVQTEQERLDADKQARIEEWIEEMIMARRRRQSASFVPSREEVR